MRRVLLAALWAILASPASAQQTVTIRATDAVTLSNVNVGESASNALRVLLVSTPTVTLNAVYSEGDPFASSDKGIHALAVRRDTAVIGAGVANGDRSTLSVDANGLLYNHTVLYDTSGVALSLSTDAVEDAPETAGGSGPFVMSVRRDTAASSAGTTGDNASFNTNALGALWVSTIDPCQDQTKSFAALNGTADATVITGTASKKIYVCSLNLVSATVQNINVVSGTGTTCQTGTTAILGLAGGTTAATGWNFAANGGIAFGNGGFAIAQVQNNADNLCVRTGGSGQYSGGLTYVVR